MAPHGIAWKASVADLGAWRRDGADFGAPLEAGAKFAFAIVRELAREALEHRLPMLLYY